MLRPVQTSIAAHLHDLIGSSGASKRDQPREDDGLFGPCSVAWRVHGDVTTMLVGGVSALLLQMLHPAALAGVWDHSDFRRDSAGRLRRTARFLSQTTFGTTEEALWVIGHIRGIHDRVNGQLPDGSRYSANDPDLLTWVHVAGVSSFLRSYLQFGRPLSASEQDRYFAETARTAELLGAVSIPRSRSDVDAYLEAMRPRLQFGPRTAEVASAVLKAPPPTPALIPARNLLMLAAADLLPRWAAKMHGLTINPVRKPAIRVGIRGVREVVRWAFSARPSDG